MLPIVYASVGNPLTFSDICEKVELANEAEILSTLKNQIKEHYSLYGTEPYSIEYSRVQDSYQIRPNGIIGRILCNQFVLEISSKFENIEVGKWLQLAHYSGATHLVQHNNEIAEGAISEKDAIDGIDYFVVALISAVYDCVNEGLIYEKGVKSGDDPNFRGKLDLRKHIQKGANPFNLQTIRNIKQFDCNANSIIKRALEICESKAVNLSLRGLANEMLSNFGEVDSEGVEEGKISYEFVSSLPRPEYEKALAISKILIVGFSAIQGDDESFVPYYTINLDELFEKFVGFELRKILREESYSVKLQGKIQHPIEPALKGNFIAPDILVLSVENEDLRPVVIDTKNKYSMLTQSGEAKLSNQDLFQMIYYCQTVGTDIAILVYPGDESACTSYPLLGSEGMAKYKAKRDSAIKSMFDDGNCAFRYMTDSSEIYIFAWRLNLSGTLHESRESLAQLSQFIADCVKKEIL